MSKHRASVIAALEGLRKHAACVDHEFLAPFPMPTGSVMLIDLISAGEDLTTRYSTYALRLRKVFTEHPIDDLREVEVTVSARFSSRESACQAGDFTSRRVLAVADVTFRSRIRTRWVHMWSESEKRIEWPIIPS